VGGESESVGAYERAVQLIADIPSAARARVLTGLAAALAFVGRPDPLKWSAEALRIARAAGDRREEGRAMQTLGYCRVMAGAVEAGLADCRQALAIATALGHSEDLCLVHSNLVGSLRMAGRTAEAAAVAMDGIEIARQRGAGRVFGTFLRGSAVEALILLGRRAEAADLLPAQPDPLAYGTGVPATNLWLAAANLHTWRGNFDTAQQSLMRA
jgi:hypothetical protein